MYQIILFQFKKYFEKVPQDSRVSCYRCYLIYLEMCTYENVENDHPPVCKFDSNPLSPLEALSTFAIEVA